MKKINIYLILIFCVSLMFSCQEDDIMEYSGMQALNMVQEEGDGTMLISGSEESKIIKIKISVMGVPSLNDRTIEMSLGENNTAVLGTTCEIPMNINLKGGTLDTIVECKVFREGLSEDAKLLDLIFKDNKDFVTGVYKNIQIKMMFGYPTSWVDDTWMAPYILGKCTQAKYKFVFEQLGTVDLNPYAGAWGSGYRDLANKWNAILDKEPRLDDDGTNMRFGMGF